MADENVAVAEPPPSNQEAATNAVMAAFDKALAPVKPAQQERPAIERPVEQIPERQPAPKEKPAPPPEPEPKPVAEKILPSFLQEQSKPKPDVAPTQDWPEELPKDNKKWKEWRQQYKDRGDQIAALTARAAAAEAKLGQVPEEFTAKYDALQKQNHELLGFVDRYKTENHPKVIAGFDQPRDAAIRFAQQIVKDAGGDVDVLNRAISARGAEHYRILDQELFPNIPESAKNELGGVFTRIKDIEARKAQFLSDPRRAQETLQREDLTNERNRIAAQQKELEGELDNIVAEMRDKHKLEVFQRSTDPKEQWWNDQGDQIIAVAKDIMRSPDRKRLTAAVTLGATADVYRQLFLNTAKQLNEANAELEGIRGKEPNIGGMDNGAPMVSEKEQLQKPFAQAFLEQLKKARNQP
jgi:hypothetical protein